MENFFFVQVSINIHIFSFALQRPRHRYVLRYWQTRTHCCGHVVAHDVSHVGQTGKHLFRTQNVSDQNQKHFLCPGHKICVRNKCCARGQTGKHFCRQQCVRNNVFSFASTLIKDGSAVLREMIFLKHLFNSAS